MQYFVSIKANFIKKTPLLLSLDFVFNFYIYNTVIPLH